MSDFNEAVVLIAKCGERHKTYGSTGNTVLEKRQRNGWAFAGGGLGPAALERMVVDKTFRFYSMFPASGSVRKKWPVPQDGLWGGPFYLPVIFL